MPRLFRFRVIKPGTKYKCRLRLRTGSLNRLPVPSWPYLSGDVWGDDNGRIVSFFVCGNEMKI